MDQSPSITSASATALRLPWPWLAAAIMAAAVCFTLLRIPTQVNDSLVPMLDVQATPTAAAVLVDKVSGTAYLRPFWWVQVKMLFDAASGHYFLAFKTFHVALVGVLFFLFVRVAKVRTRTDLLAFLFALTVLTGLHTFVGTVWEAYPINHYLEIAVFSLAALVLAQSRGGWWVDTAAVILFTGAALTLESGLLVWTVFVSAYLVGLRGISAKALVVLTCLFAGYFFLRFGYLHVGTPSLLERSSGFGLNRLEAAELAQRFDERPVLFYLYNVACSFLSVLLSEPRGGTWGITARWVQGNVTPADVVNLLSSLIATALVVCFAIMRRRAWMSRWFEPADQLVLVFVAVAAGNATLSYAYAKDEILSTAGVFYALAVFAAARETLVWFGRARRSMAAVVTLTALLFIGASAWAVRATGLHYRMLYMASTVRQDWSDVDEFLRDEHIDVTTPEAVSLVDRLRHEAIEMPVVNEYFFPRWGNTWFESGRQ